MIRNYLTSLFLFAYISSGVDPIRTALDAGSAKWFRGVWISGIVVAVGCTLEIWEVVHDLRNWKRSRNGKEPLKENLGSWMYPLAAIGLFLVVGGIVSETIFEVLDANVESRYRSHESDKITAAESDASTAEDSAQKVNDALKEAMQLLGEIEEKTKEVSEQAGALTLHMGEIKKAVDFDTPRNLILVAAAPKIVKILKPYAGQKVGLYMCDTHPHDFEAGDTWGALANILERDTSMGLNKPHFFGANWKEVPNNLTLIKGNCGGMGIDVFVSSKASDKTRQAGKALADAIFETLPQTVYNHFGTADPEYVQRVRQLGYMTGDSAFVAAAFDPNLVTVQIDSHPTQ